jgi:hypothetical protein
MMGIKSQTMLLLAGVLLMVGACSAKRGPSDEAIRAYGVWKASEGAGEADEKSAANKTPEARAKKGYATQVKLTVVRGADIPDNDPGPGHTDAYVIVEYEGDRHKTAIRSSESPRWGDHFILDTRPGGVLKVTLMDDDLVSDDNLGVASQQLPTVRPGQTQEFKMVFHGGQGGEVHLSVLGLQ